MINGWTISFEEVLSDDNRRVLEEWSRAVQQVEAKLPREPITHDVKSWSFLFAPMILGLKTHDIRYQHERDYRVGDLMKMREFDEVKQKYTGRYQMVEITYVTDDNSPCAVSRNVLDRMACILSIKRIGEVQSDPHP